MKVNEKIHIYWILAHLVENCGSQGKNRGLVITQSTLGYGLIKKRFSKKWQWVQKTRVFWIFAHLVKNHVSQGKNRVFVIAENTLERGLIKNPIF